MHSHPNVSKYRSLVIAAAALAGAFAITPMGTASAFTPPPTPAPVPQVFIDNGPGEHKSISFDRYCKMVYGATARQWVGPNKRWNEWKCLIGSGGVASGSTGIDLFDVCRKLYDSGHKPVNNTGSAYNWYCKRK